MMKVTNFIEKSASNGKHKAGYNVNQENHGNRWPSEGT